jgi:FkbM family methyltransferase
VRNEAGENNAVAVDGLLIGGDPRVHGRYLRTLEVRPPKPLMTRLFRDAIPRGGAVIDGGAHLGYHALIAARQVGPRGRVMAFEPDPSSYRALRANARRNGYGERVIALPLGIGAWSGRRTFYLGQQESSGESPFVPGRWREGAETRTLSLDSTVAGRSIDVIKLSVEGGELDALRGMRRTLELSPGARLFIDCKPAALARAGSSAAALLEELVELGFRTRVIEEVHGELAPAGEWLDEVSGRVQLLCEPQSVRHRIAGRMRTARLEPGASVPA